MSETYEFKTTIKTSVHFTQDNLLFIDAAKSLIESGRSARINGLIERYREVFYEYQPKLNKIFSKNDLLRLADGWMSDGKNGSWIGSWASNRIEEADDLGLDVEDFIRSDTLISKISKLTAVEISVLEEMVAMHLLAIERGDLSEREFSIIKAKLKAKLNSDPGESAAYLTGQIKGLNRRYHGESFGEKEVHNKLIVEDSDRGKGYRDGFNLTNLPV